MKLGVITISIAVLFLASGIVGCQKERIEEHPEYVGEWASTNYFVWHYDYSRSASISINSNGEARYFSIDHDHKGKFYIRNKEIRIGLQRYPILVEPQELDWLKFDHNNEVGSHKMVLHEVEHFNMPYVAEFTMITNRYSKSDLTSFFGGHKGLWTGGLAGIKCELNLVSQDTAILELNYLSQDLFYRLTYYKEGDRLMLDWLSQEDTIAFGMEVEVLVNEDQSLGHIISQRSVDLRIDKSNSSLTIGMRNVSYDAEYAFEGLELFWD